MEEVLSKAVVGQREAIESVSNSVRIARAGLSPLTRPLGSSLFLGPTGACVCFLVRVCGRVRVGVIVRRLTMYSHGRSGQDGAV